MVMLLNRRFNLLFAIVSLVMSGLPFSVYAYTGHNKGTRRNEKGHEKCCTKINRETEHYNKHSKKQRLSNHQKQKLTNIIPIIIGSSIATNGTIPVSSPASAFVFTTDSDVAVSSNQPFEFDTIGQLSNIAFDGTSTLTIGQTGVYIIEYRVIANTLSSGINSNVLVLDVTANGLSIPGSVQAAPSPSITDPLIAQIVHGSVTATLSAGTLIQLRNVSGTGVTAQLVSITPLDGDPSVSALFRIFKLD